MVVITVANIRCWWVFNSHDEKMILPLSQDSETCICSVVNFGEAR